MKLLLKKCRQNSTKGTRPHKSLQSSKFNRCIHKSFNDFIALCIQVCFEDLQNAITKIVSEYEYNIGLFYF